MAGGDALGEAEQAGELVYLPFVEARDRLDVGEAVAALDEEALVVLEQVGRADDRVAERVGPGVLDQLAHALLHVRGREQGPVGVGWHPAGLLGAVRWLHHDREHDHAAGRSGAHQLVAPGRLVVFKHRANRLVAAAVAAEALERVGDRLLFGWGAQRAGELETEIERGRADVALGKPQAEHPLGAEGARADRRGHSRVDTARDCHDRAAAAELANGVCGAVHEAGQPGGRIEVRGVATSRHAAVTKALRRHPDGPFGLNPGFLAAAAVVPRGLSSTRW